MQRKSQKSASIKENLKNHNNSGRGKQTNYMYRSYCLVNLVIEFDLWETWDGRECSPTRSKEYLWATKERVEYMMNQLIISSLLKLSIQW